MIDNVKIGQDGNRIRQIEAYRLRCAGMGYDDIADVLTKKMPGVCPPGYSSAKAYSDVKTAIKSFSAEVIEHASETIALEIHRLDDLYMVFNASALQGDTKAARVCLDIMKRRSELLGLDKPKTVNVKDWRTEILDLLREGKITVSDIKRELGDEIAIDIVKEIGNGTGESSESGSTRLLESGEIQEGDFILTEKTMAGETRS